MLTKNTPYSTCCSLVHIPRVTYCASTLQSPRKEWPMRELISFSYRARRNIYIREYRLTVVVLPHTRSIYHPHKCSKDGNLILEYNDYRRRNYSNVEKKLSFDAPIFRLFFLDVSAGILIE